MRQRSGLKPLNIRGSRVRTTPANGLGEMRDSMDEYFSFLSDQLGKSFDKFWLPRRFPLLPPMFFPSAPELEVSLHEPKQCCGKRLKDSWDFCPTCGKKIE